MLKNTGQFAKSELFNRRRKWERWRAGRIREFQTLQVKVFLEM